MDQGERLGRSKAAFENRWFNRNAYTYEVTPKPGAQDEIIDRLKDVMFSLDPKDHAALPPMIAKPIKVRLPENVMKEYRQFKRTLVSEE